MRTTLTLDDDVAALLERQAATLGVSLADLAQSTDARDAADARRGSMRPPCGAGAAGVPHSADSLAFTPQAKTRTGRAEWSGKS